MLTYFFVLILFVYVSFIIVKNCGFVMGFVILIYFRLKTTIFSVKSKNLMAFQKKISW